MACHHHKDKLEVLWYVKTFRSRHSLGFNFASNQPFCPPWILSISVMLKCLGITKCSTIPLMPLYLCSKYWHPLLAWIPFSQVYALWCSHSTLHRSLQNRTHEAGTSQVFKWLLLCARLSKDKDYDLTQFSLTTLHKWSHKHMMSDENQGFPLREHVIKSGKENIQK